jgi:hypothetical protein
MEAKLCFVGHRLMENRCGLVVDAWLTPVVSGHAGGGNDRAVRVISGSHA